MARSLIFALGGGTLLTAAAVAGWIVTRMHEDAPAPAPSPVAPLASALPAPTDAAPADAAPADAAPNDAVPGPVAAAQDPAGPGFDVVRVDREGGALVAGRAAPGAAVTLRVDGAVVAQVAADANGQFVALFTLGPSAAVQSMTLEVTDADGRVTQAPDVVILTPRPPAGDTAVALAAAPQTPAAEVPAPAAPAQEGPQPQAAPVAVQGAVEVAAAEPAVPAPVPAPTQDLAPGTSDAAAPELPIPAAAADAPAALPAPDAPAPLALAQAEPQAVAPQAPDQPAMPSAFLVQGDGAVRVLDRAPAVLDNVIIDSISYSGTGDVQIAGRAARSAPAANLRIYLDNRPIAVTRADSGDWTSDLPAVDPGVYTLRVDQLNDAGGVVSRFETPFQREAPETVAAARAQGAAPSETPTVTPTVADAGSAVTTDRPAIPVATAPASQAAGTVQPSAQPRAALITVQPGNTLWAISQARYGAGERYVVIYNANRSQIRDPDLIYPGQIFALPDQ